MRIRAGLVTLALVVAASAAACAARGSADLVEIEPTDDAVATLEARLAEAPRDADAALNLGVVHARRGELGEAVHVLEVARLAAPRDRDVQDALALTHQQARMRRAEAMPNVTIVEGEPEAMAWWRFFRAFGAGAWAWTLLAGSWMCCGLMLARRSLVRPAARDAALVGASLGIAAVVTASALFVGREVTGARITPAVVVAAEPTYRDAPDELSPRRRQANLYEGAVTLLIDARADWLLLELVDGQRVWVQARTARAVTIPR